MGKWKSYKKTSLKRIITRFKQGFWKLNGIRGGEGKAWFSCLFLLDF
jgi:hypothetical protein